MREVELRKYWVVLQEGGTCLEIYPTAWYTEHAAEQHQDACEAGAYRTERFQVEAVNSNEVQRVVEAMAMAVERWAEL